MMKQNEQSSVHRPHITEVRAEHRRLRYKMRYRRTLLSTVAVLLVAAAAAILVATLVMPVLRIYGTSMSPTLHDDEIVASIAEKEFKTGDIVAFYYGNKILVKRCIAGPGDWVEIDGDGNVTVNGVLLVEPYLTEKTLGICDLEFPYQVPDEHWFLMGDNRAESVDSRSEQLGCIRTEDMIGRIFFRIWPLNQAGGIQ